MQARQQATFSSILMVAAVLPWLAMVGWIIAILTLNVRGEPPRVAMLDPIGMIGLGIAVYLCSLLVAGAACCWSLVLTHRHPELRSKKKNMLRAGIVTAFLLPLLNSAFFWAYHLF
jgi:hypothetical protein